MAVSSKSLWTVLIGLSFVVLAVWAPPSLVPAEPIGGVDFGRMTRLVFVVGGVGTIVLGILRFFARRINKDLNPPLSRRSVIPMNERGDVPLVEARLRQILKEIEIGVTENSGADVFARHTTPDYVFTSPTGRVSNRSEVLDGLRTGGVRFNSYSMADLDIRLYDSLAVVMVPIALLPYGPARAQSGNSSRGRQQKSGHN